MTRYIVRGRYTETYEVETVVEAQSEAEAIDLAEEGQHVERWPSLSPAKWRHGVKP